jgi:DNA-damage-inducible protein J
MMSKTAMIRARVDPILKEEVEMILEAIGLSTTQAITLFYQQVRLSRGLPFDLRVPNTITLQTFTDTDAGENLVRCQNADDLFERLGI